MKRTLGQFKGYRGYGRAATFSAMMKIQRPVERKNGEQMSYAERVERIRAMRERWSRK